MLHRMNLLLTPPKEQQRSGPFLFWDLWAWHGCESFYGLLLPEKIQQQ